MERLSPPTHPHLLRMFKDGRTVEYRGASAHLEDYGVVQATSAISMDEDISYFEATVLETTPRSTTSSVPSLTTDVAIGFAPRHYGGSSCSPSTCANSFGWRSADGWLFEQWGNGSEGSAAAREFSPPWGQGDVVGAGVDLVARCVFFTRNGSFVGSTPLKLGWKSRIFLQLDPAGENHGSSKRTRRLDLYATVAMHSTGDKLRLNVGGAEGADQPFRFDLEAYLAAQRKSTLATSPPPAAVSESTIHRLVQEYLLQRGYVGAADAFNARLRELGGNSAGCRTAEDPPAPRRAAKECRKPRRACADLHRLHCTADERAQLHAWITGHEAATAIAHLEQHHPVLQRKNPVVALALAAQSFIDLLLRGDSLAALEVARKRFPPCAIEKLDATTSKMPHGNSPLPWLNSRSTEDVDLAPAVQHLVGLLAYDDIRESGALSYLSSREHAHAVSLLVNNALCARSGSDAANGPHSTLEMILWHGLAAKELQRELGGSSSSFALPSFPQDPTHL